MNVSIHARFVTPAEVEEYLGRLRRAEFWRAVEGPGGILEQRQAARQYRPLPARPAIPPYLRVRPTMVRSPRGWLRDSRRYLRGV